MAEPRKTNDADIFGLPSTPVFGSEKELLRAMETGAMPKRSFADYAASMNKAAETSQEAPLVKSALGVWTESSRPTPSRIGGGGGLPAAQMILPTEKTAALEPPKPQPDVTAIPAPQDVQAPPPIAEFATPKAKAIVKDSLSGVMHLLEGMGVKPSTGDAASELFSLADDDLHPAVLDVLFTGFFGDEWHDWEHDTLTAALKDIEAEGGGTTSEQNRTKLLAMQALHSTTYPWVSMQPFAKCALALDNRIPDLGVLEPVHPATCLCALGVMRGINPAGEFSHEVIRFIAASCVHDGTMIFPDELLGEKVGEVVKRLTNKSLSESDWDVMMSIWQRFVEAGGISAGDHAPDETDESNLVDHQIATAARLAAYAEDFDARRAKQMSSLLSWVMQAKRS